MGFLRKKDVLELLMHLMAELNFELKVRQTDMFDSDKPFNTRVIRASDPPEDGIGLPPEMYSRLKSMFIFLKGMHQSAYDTRITSLNVEVIRLKKELEWQKTQTKMYKRWTETAYDQGWKDSRTFTFVEARDICEEKCDYAHEIRRAHQFLQDYCRYECPRGEKTMGHNSVSCSSAACDLEMFMLCLMGLQAIWIRPLIIRSQAGILSLREWRKRTERMLILTILIG